MPFIHEAFSLLALSCIFSLALGEDSPALGKRAWNEVRAHNYTDRDAKCLLAPLECKESIEQQRRLLSEIVREGRRKRSKRSTNTSVITQQSRLPASRSSSLDDGAFMESLIQRLDFSIDARLYGLLDIIHRLSLPSRFNYTYWMHGGTLLGSAAMHHRMPWDDDADMMLLAEHEELFEAAMASVRLSEGICFEHVLYSSRKVRIIQVNWCDKVHPYVHMVLATRRSDGNIEEDTEATKNAIVDRVSKTTTVNNTTSNSEKYDIWKASDVFPLIPRPFGPLMLPAPHGYRTILLNKYGVDVYRFTGSSDGGHVTKRSSHATAGGDEGRDMCILPLELSGANTAPEGDDVAKRVHRCLISRRVLPYVVMRNESMCLDERSPRIILGKPLNARSGGHIDGGSSASVCIEDLRLNGTLLQSFTYIPGVSGAASISYGNRGKNGYDTALGYPYMLYREFGLWSLNRHLGTIGSNSSSRSSNSRGFQMPLHMNLSVPFRHWLLQNPFDLSASALNALVYDYISSPVVTELPQNGDHSLSPSADDEHKSLGRRERSTNTFSGLSVAFFNAERGTYTKQMARELNRVFGTYGAGAIGSSQSNGRLVILNEMDIGMLRSSNVNTIDELSRLLRVKYQSYGVEFVELTHGNQEEIDALRKQGVYGDNLHGLHTNAILSDFPIRNAEVFKLQPQFDALYHHDSNGIAKGERRLGQRMALMVDVHVPISSRRKKDASARVDHVKAATTTTTSAATHTPNPPPISSLPAQDGAKEAAEMVITVVSMHAQCSRGPKQGYLRDVMALCNRIDSRVSSSVPKMSGVPSSVTNAVVLAGDICQQQKFADLLVKHCDFLSLKTTNDMRRGTYSRSRRCESISDFRSRGDWILVRPAGARRSIYTTTTTTTTTTTNTTTTTASTTTRIPSMRTTAHTIPTATTATTTTSGASRSRQRGKRTDGGVVRSLADASEVHNSNSHTFTGVHLDRFPARRNQSVLLPVTGSARVHVPSALQGSDTISIVSNSSTSHSDTTGRCISDHAILSLQIGFN